MKIPQAKSSLGGLLGALTLGLLLVFAVASCGKRNAPAPPDKIPTSYPRSYPTT